MYRIENTSSDVLLKGMFIAQLEVTSYSDVFTIVARILCCENIYGVAA
jgi:hypothetical protein